MPLLSWLLLAVLSVGLALRASCSEEKPWFLRTRDELRPSFFHLPVFHHASRPLVAPEIFRPVPPRRASPAGLTSLLLPTVREAGSNPERSARAVDVWCGVDKVNVRVDRLQLRTWTVPSLFRLGSCRPSKVGLRFFYFQYGLKACDGDSKVVGGQLVYTYLLTYTPPPQDYVLRVVPLNFPIRCQYNRFHYSYKVGFRPQLQLTSFTRSIKAKLSFSLTICNAQWEPLHPGHWFYLGEQVYFLAQTGTLLAGERLYVDTCYATNSRDQDSTPRVEIISNYGCMVDSKRNGSSSQFLSREASVLKFSADTFLFKAGSQMLYLHCSIGLGLASSENSKSCNFNQASGRWEELEAPASVCSCCDSMCADTQNSIEYRVSSPGWIIREKVEDKFEINGRSFQAEEGQKWLNEEEENDKEKNGKTHEVELFQQRKGMGLTEENKQDPSLLLVNKKQRKLGPALSGQGKKEGNETEVIAVEKAHELEKEVMSDVKIISDKSGPQEDMDFCTKHISVQDLSGSDRSIPSEARFDTTDARSCKFRMNPDHNNHGIIKDVSSAVIPTTKPCSFGVNGCSVTKPDHGSANNDGSTTAGINTSDSEDKKPVHTAGLRDPGCLDGLPCKSDFVFGTEEDEVLNWSQSTGVKSRSSISASSQERNWDSQSHYTVVAVFPLTGSASDDMTDKVETEMMPHWGLLNFKNAN